MKQYISLLLVLMTIAFIGCTSSKDAGKVVQQAGQVRTSASTPGVVPANNSEALPKAVIYRMNGDYAQYVPITLSRSGKQVISYPAPTDLNANSTPLDLGDGWWLDRRGGIGPNTAFLDYTYDQYRSLKEAPSPSTLLKHVKSEAKVTEFKALPITLGEALADPAALQQYK